MGDKEQETLEKKMASQKQNPLRKIGEQIQSIMPTQTLNPQKSLEGAKVVESFESIPEVYQEFFQPHLARGETLPYTVLTPTYEISGDTVAGKLVCVIDHTLYVLERNENGLSKVCYPIDEINTVEVIHRPADLHVKVNGFTNLGQPATSVFGCSKSTDYIFAPLFQRIRLRIDSLNERAPSRHMERLDRWSDLKTGVLDMARHCLMAGETVIESILQPEIHPNIFSPDRVFRGAKCATHICILTDKELVLIREDLPLGKKDTCNSVCNFIPLNKINSLNVNRENEKFLVVSIRTTNGDVFESLFDVSLENDVNQFLARTREFIPKERSYRRDQGTSA